MYCIDESGVTYNKVLNTNDTLFDFSKSKLISECLSGSHIQLERNLGVDNYFLKKDQTNPFMVEMRVNDLVLRMWPSHVTFTVLVVKRDISITLIKVSAGGSVLTGNSGTKMLLSGGMFCGNYI